MTYTVIHIASKEIIIRAMACDARSQKPDETAETQKYLDNAGVHQTLTGFEM
jgi:hypothetical protein